MNTDLADIYGISGFFIENHTPSRMTFFGGSFSSKDSPRFLLGGKEVRGQLVDPYGSSTIEGKLDSTSLEFRKKYDGRMDTINYNFKFDSQKGLWVGSYNGEPQIGDGTSICKIHLDWKDVSLIRPQYEHPEIWAKRMVDEMLEGGMLEEIVEDGISVIRPKKLD